MLIKQIIEFQMTGPGLPWTYMYPFNLIISWQNKNIYRKSSSGSLFTAKILQKAMHLTSSYLCQILTIKI